MDMMNPMVMQGINPNMLLGQIINQIVGQNPAPPVAGASPGGVPQQQGTGTGQANLPDVMAQAQDAFTKGLISKIKEHGENAAPMLTSAIIQGLMNSTQQPPFPMPQDMGGGKQMQTPPPGGPPPGGMNQADTSGLSQGAGVGLQAGQQEQPPSSGKTQGGGKGNIWTALIGAGAGLQGKDPGEAILSALTAQGKQPIQPAQKQELEIRKYSAQVQLATDEYARLTSEITANSNQITALQHSLTFHPFIRFGQQKQLLDRNNELMTQLKSAHDKMNTLLSSPPKSVTSQGGQGNTFATEAEALKSGVKGNVTINGRPARID